MHSTCVYFFPLLPLPPPPPQPDPKHNPTGPLLPHVPSIPACCMQDCALCSITCAWLHM